MKIVNAQQARSWDQHAIEKVGIPGVVLMERASFEAARVFVDHFDIDVEDSIGIVCGPGNNGGDGLAMARILDAQGFHVTVYSEAVYSGDAETNFQIATALGIPIRPFSELASHTFLVDALFGTGLNRPIDGVYGEVVAFMNRQPNLFSLDVPSGLRDVKESELGEVVWADATVTFAAAKLALVLEPGRSCAGELYVVEIGIPEISKEAVGWYAQWLVAPRDLAPRPPKYHKGDAGRVVVVSGEMPGAAQLSAEAAIRSGAGLVRLVGRDVAPVARCPELMVQNVDDWAAAFEWGDVVVVGPGLGTSEDATEAVLAAWESSAKLVVDADALNIISQNRDRFAPRDNQTVLTPHPGEMARLLGVETRDAADVSIGAAIDLAKKFGAVVVHKTETTIVVHGDRIAINATGNSGMATAGTGDVLSGIISARIADRFEELFNGVCDAVCAHGSAGDRSADRNGESGVTATSVIESLGSVWRDWERE